MFLPIIRPILRIAALVISLLVYALTIMAAYGGRFNTDFFTFPAMLTLGLPYLAVATVIIIVGWLLARSYFTAALGVLAMICAWNPISTVCPIGGSRKPTPGAKTFTLLTYNIKHAEDQEYPDAPTGNRAIEYIINSGADIVCCQELVKIDSTELRNFTPTLEDSLRKAYPYWAGDPSLDMKVFSKYPVTFERAYNFIEGNFDPKRYTFYRLTVQGRKMTLINFHFTSFALKGEETKVVTNIKDVESAKASMNEMKGTIRMKMSRGFKRRKWDAEVLRRTIDKIPGAVILCGDFNDVPESYAYRLLRGEDLKDAYVETGFGPMITFNQHMFWFHLDQIFYRGPLKALSVKRGSTKASDHYPVMAEFEWLPDGSQAQ